MSLLPRSLFGRTLLVLALGLVLAQAVSIVLNLYDRSSSVYRLAAYQVSLRIAQTARILNRTPAALRTAVLEEVNGVDFSVVLRKLPLDLEEGYAEHNGYERAIAESIRRQLGAPWPVTVDIATLNPARGATAAPLGGQGEFERWLARHFYFLLPNAFAVVSQVRLEDGALAVFYAVIPQEPLSRLETLLPRLALTLALFLALAALGVRWITSSLQQLARAAEALGADPGGAPLAERGPSEVRSTIAAFNRMQAQVRRFMQERARLLGAISHDLKTPITRMRLRCEMLGNPELRAKFARDLDEMEAMVGSSLEFFSSLGDAPQRQPVDIAALAESLAEDLCETGAEVVVRGAARGPYHGHPQALRRCLDNLVGNALRYAGRAEIVIEDDGALLRVTIRDDGPGIPEQELERVFEPYYRLESSRNRGSGGTGLGLSIARNIARWHGGEVSLRNAPDGAGLIAEIVLPRAR